MMNTRLLIALAGLAATSSVHADNRYFLAGGEVADGNYYGYSGFVLPGPHYKDGRGFVQRYWIDAFGYEYDGATDRIQAEAYGGEAALGYTVGSASGWGTVWLGARYTNTDLTPDDPGATARGSQLGAKLQVEGEHQVAERWRIGGSASYTTAQNGYWGRARLMHGTPARAFGVEVVANGNEEAHSESAGLVFSFQPVGDKVSIAFKAGYRKQEGSDGPYGGIEFGYAF